MIARGLASVTVTDSRAKLSLQDDGRVAQTSIPLTRLPEAFIRWQLEARRVLFSSHMATVERVRRFQAHLPVLVSKRPYGAFPFHTANKGTGLLPLPEFLAQYTSEFRRLLAERDQDTWRESLKDRIALMDSLYSAPDRLDLRCLGSLEIFQGQTYQNVLKDPRVCMHYTGEGPDYPSFQINAVAEVIGPGEPRYEFLY